MKLRVLKGTIGPHVRGSRNLHRAFIVQNEEKPEQMVQHHDIPTAVVTWLLTYGASEGISLDVTNVEAIMADNHVFPMLNRDRDALARETDEVAAANEKLWQQQKADSDTQRSLRQARHKKD